MNDWRTRPHRRRNPLTGEWVLVSPHRLQRPWQGERSQTIVQARPQYDPACYLCPGNTRANGERNPAYESTFQFENDYAALLDDVPEGGVDDGLFTARDERGRCRVLCFSPRHDLDIATLERKAVLSVVDAWAQAYEDLTAVPYVQAVTIFENRGAAMGASNPHPHGQIWANESVPNELLKETGGQRAYRAVSGNCLLCAYAQREIDAGERVVYSDDHMLVVVPFWAVWPFETMIVPRRHAAALVDLQPQERGALADAMQSLVQRYDRLFDTPFPYSMGVHQQPCDGGAHDEWHVHAHYYPPLLRSATVRKYMVGYEMLAQPQRDITAETAAERLRSV